MEVLWNLPHPGWIKIDIDGSARGALGQSGVVVFFVPAEVL